MTRFRRSIKQPLIRRGETKPYVKPTNAELAKRVETVARLLGDRMATKTEVHEYCRQHYSAHWRTADRYVVRARDFLLQRAGKTKEQVLGEAVTFYEDVLRAEQRRVIVKEGEEPRVTGTTVGEKLVARDKLNELYAIYPPKRSEITGADGAPMQVNTTVPLSPQMRERLHNAWREKIRRECRREFKAEAAARAAAAAPKAEIKPSPSPAVEPVEPVEPPKGDVLV